MENNNLSFDLNSIKECHCCRPCDSSCDCEKIEIKKPYDLRQRMYCLVLRQLNQMQKGVQSAHSVVEYIRRFGDSTEVVRWMDIDKTLILLDGGTYPDMLETIQAFNENGVWYSFFNEPDLNDMVTCISVVASELVWDRETYPDYSGAVIQIDESTDFEKRNYETLKGYGLTDREIFLRNFLGGLRLAN